MVYRRWVVVESEKGSPGEMEVARYEDPAVAWRDIEDVLEAFVQTDVNMPAEYALLEIRTNDPKVKKLRV